MFVRIFFLVLFSVAISCSPQAQNIALNKPYALSTPPNYRYSAPSTDKISLTDGIYTKSQFWKKPTTVGWQNRQVTITIDLLNSEPIGSVGFNTARKTSVGVNFPQNIFVFLSEDNHTYQFAGDAADTSENLPGDYKIHLFSLPINAPARYVKLVVIPNGKRIFCDEIEILKGRQSHQLKQNVSATDINSFVDSLISLSSNKKRINNLVQKPDIPLLKEKLEKNPQKGEEIILKGSSEILQKKFNTSYVVNLVKPWDTISEYYQPRNELSTQNVVLYFAVESNKFGAFTITNTGPSEENIFFHIVSDPSVDVKLYDTPFVPSGNHSFVPDPVVPVENLNIIPGATKLILFQLRSGKPGVATSKIEIKSPSKKVVLNLESHVIDLGNKISNHLPNANVWAYLNTPMLKGIEAEAGRDLAKHHVNTMVINSRILPKMGTSDVSELIKYLKNFQKADNILLFTRFSSKGKGESGPNFMTPKWQRDFSEWYNIVVQTIRKNGFHNARILVYPYDEVRGKDIADFERFALWVKKESPNIQLFATISNEDAKRTILPLVDIAQIQAKNNLFKNLPAHSAEIWTYENGSPARALPPYQFYRLKAWRAFYNDIKGVGFWSYSSENKEMGRNLFQKNLSVPTASFSVIYNGEDNHIISSRRWEAFGVGLEDYAILKIHAQKYGLEKTKSMVKSVLNSPNDIEKADQVIGKILRELE